MLNDLQIVLSGDRADFTTNFEPAIILDEGERYVASLINLETLHSFPNVETGINDTFKFSEDRGVTWRTVQFREGSYSLDNLAGVIRHATGDAALSLVPDVASGVVEMRVNGLDLWVDFKDDATSVGPMLGFDAVVYAAGLHTSSKPVRIVKVNSILVNCDIVGNSYVDGRPQATLYSFYPAVEHGCKIVETPFSPVWLPVVKSHIYTVRVWLTDESNRPLNLRGEKITLRLNIIKERGQNRRHARF